MNIKDVIKSLAKSKDSKPVASLEPFFSERKKNAPLVLNLNNKEAVNVSTTK